MHPFRHEGGGSWWPDDRNAGENRGRGDDPRGYGEGRYGQRGGPAHDYGEGRYEGRQRHDGGVREQGYYGGRASPAQRVWESSAQRPPWEEDEAWRRGSEVRDEWGDGGGGSRGQAPRERLRGRDRVGPKGYQRSDDRIREDICERLAHAHHVDVRDVEVEVQGGVVRLTGNVRDRRQKYCIEDIVDDVFGVQEIHNAVRLGAPGAFGVSGITEGAQGGAQDGRSGQGHVSGISSSGSATGASASSYGGGMETGSGGPGQGRDSTGGTTRMG